MIRKILFATGMLAIAGSALTASAQDELPAVNTKDAATAPVAPAPAAAAKPAVNTGDTGGGGTTIIGERESPIGLYITPWRETSAESDLDRPARLLQEKLLPIDKAVFQREIDYYDALSAELKRKGLITPAAH